MSKSETAAKPSGAHSFGSKTNYVKPEKQQGPHHTKKHELPAKQQGVHDAGKPIVPAESVTHHSGRQHPPATKLADSKILGGRLRKSDNV